MKKLLFFVCCLLLATTSFAQKKPDLFDANQTVTWLGLDFSQMKFIGEATQWKDAGEITNSQLRDKFVPAGMSFSSKKKTGVK